MPKYIPPTDTRKTLDSLVGVTRMLHDGAKAALQEYVLGGLFSVDDNLKQMREDLAMLKRELDGAEWVLTQAIKDAERVSRPKRVRK